MRCTQCAAVSYSAAARTLVERGDRCPQCGGELVLSEREQPQTVGVSVAETPSEADSRESRERARRFESD